MFRYLFDDLSLFDQETFADSTGDSDIRTSRLARSVAHAAHNGYLHIKIHAGYHILYLICQVNEVDLGSSAGRTGNNFHAALPEP